MFNRAKALKFVHSRIREHPTQCRTRHSSTRAAEAEAEAEGTEEADGADFDIDTSFPSGVIRIMIGARQLHGRWDLRWRYTGTNLARRRVSPPSDRDA